MGVVFVEKYMEGAKTNQSDMNSNIFLLFFFSLKLGALRW